MAPRRTPAKKHPLPAGYESLHEDCKRLLADHPRFDRNVFIMTRFDATDRLLAQLDEELRKKLCRHGLNGLRADDRMYAHDDQVWTNVCVYMLCCGLGVAVLEDRAQDEFNPNVALEYGFMRALDRRTLLLADRGFRNLRADVFGTLRQQFDIADVVGTLHAPLERWIRDLGIDVVAGPSELQQLAHLTYQRLLKIRCARLVHDDARQKKERNDEFWHLGKEIAEYRGFLQGRPDPAHQAAVEDVYRRVVKGHDTAVDDLITLFAALAR